MATEDEKAVIRWLNKINDEALMYSTNDNIDELNAVGAILDAVSKWQDVVAMRNK